MLEVVLKAGTGYGTLKKYNYNIDKETGWFCIEKYPWVVYLRLLNSTKYPIPSHCHQDFGSPVIFYKNQEIIIDPGRASYLKEFDYESSASNHSTFLINNKPTAPSERDISLFLQPTIAFKYKIYNLDKKICLLIRYPKTFTNIFKVKYAFRQIVINDKSVDIRDRIALFRESIISTRFNFTNNLNNFMRNFTYKVDSENLKKIIINDQSKNIDLASRSVEYNKSKEYNAFSLKFCTKKFFMSKLSISK